jgi:FSR family fosmidomycin resistance protein-like MFS transporter
MVLLSPLVGLFLLTGDNVIGFACLGLAGGCTVATFGVVVVMGQSYLPARVGVAAGFTVGLSIGLGGFAAPALGAIADAHGLFTTMVLVAVLPVGGALFALTLPEVGPSRVARR